MVMTKILIFMFFCYAKCSDIVVDYECSTFKQIYRKSECCENNKAYIHLNYTCPDVPSPSPCPVAPLPPPCPVLSPPPTVCEGLLCKKPKEDRLDVILKRQVLNVGFPSTTVSGFTEYLTCPICDYPRPSGFLGCLLKSVSTAIFGKYLQSNTRTITNYTKIERLYYGTVDMDISYGVINNLPTKVNFPSTSSVTLDVDAHFATTSPAIFIDEKYHKICNLCKDIDIKGKLIRAVHKKIGLQSETKEFVMSAPQYTASYDMLMALITSIWKDVKNKTGVEIVLVSSDASVESVGKSINVTLLGELQVKTLDAVADTDFVLLLQEPGTIQLTQYDKVTYGLEKFVTKHGLTFAYDVYGDIVNNKLKSVSNKAVSCLNMLDKYGVHTVYDLNMVHPIVKHMVESDKVCHNILTHVGSMKTCRDEITENADIDYTLNTH